VSRPFSRGDTQPTPSVSPAQPVWQDYPVNQTGAVVAADPPTEAPRNHEPTKRRHAAREQASRYWLLGAAALSLAAFVPPAFGRQVFDTKTDLETRPVAVLSGLWHLWDPRGWFGTIRNQRAGYAFPTAPLFILGQAARVPPWLTERIWMALAVTAAFWGVVRLLEALAVGDLVSRLLAGTAYALWPTFTVLVGSNTGSILPEMLIPWAVLPLVRGMKRGSTMKAAALSGVAVLCMGGINAANTLDALIVPGLYLLTRPSSQRRNSLIGWWFLCVVLGTAWWAVPLVFEGGYGFNFLPYVEQSVTTTATSSALSSLQGTSNWTAYLNEGSWNQAGAAVVSSAAVLLASAAVAGFGLYGLAREDVPERRFLRWCVGIGLTAAAAGYWGEIGDPFSRTVRGLLNGPLVPFRNVYKFSPTITLALVVAAAHGLHVLWAGRRSLDWRRPLATAMAATALVGLAVPYLQGKVLPGESYARIPAYWSTLARFLQANSPRTAALLLPAEAHGQFIWGWSIDNPLESLSTSPWVDREITPFGGPAPQRMLDAIDQAVQAGLPAPGFPALLARSGIRYVVVQNDLQWQVSDDPSPAEVDQFLVAEGFSLVKSFGPKVSVQQAGPSPTHAVTTATAKLSLPSLQVYALPSKVTTAPFLVYPEASTALVSGGPEATLQLLNAGILRPGQGAILAGDWSGPYKGAAFDVTDTLRRTNTLFGFANDNYDYPYTASQQMVAPARQGAGVSPPNQMLPFKGVQHETVAEYTGATSITASSDGSWFYALPEYEPSNVFVAHENTGWVAANPFGSVGQWIQINFAKPTSVAGAQIELLLGSGHPAASQVRVTTSAGSVLSNLKDVAGEQPLKVPAGDATYLRITFTKVPGQVPGGPNAGLRSVVIPGLQVQQYLKPPEEPVGWGAQGVSFSFAAPQVSPAAILRQEPEPIMARVFDTPRALTFTVAGTVVPQRGPTLDALLGTSGLLIGASSTLDSLPTLRPQNLFDGDPASYWIAGTSPATVNLVWHGTRKLDQVTVDFTAASVPAARPGEIELSSPAGKRLIKLPTTGRSATVKFPVLDTDELTISFLDVAKVPARGIGNQRVFEPVGLADITFPALSDLAVRVPGPSSMVRLACGQGPTLTIDGKAYETSISATYSQIENLLPLPLHLCGAGTHPRLTLASGTHHLVSGVNSPFEVASLSMWSAPPPYVGKPRSVTLKAWQDDSRTLAIGPGSASYLEVHENYDAGWVATLNGKPLRSIVLDGWQQGFAVPAGPGGIVQLTFAPQALYLAGLLAGLAGVVVLLVLASGVIRRRKPQGDEPAEPQPAPAPASGPAHAAHSARSGWRGGRGHTAFVAVQIGLVTLAIAICGGVVAVLVPVVAAVKWRWPRLLAPAAGLAVAAAGAISAYDPGMGAATRVGSFSPSAQLLALCAVAAAIVARPGRAVEKQT
jgi:arabinofuranan 3-O-arabinosyltransferase